MSILNFITKDATLSMPITHYEALLAKAAADERERIMKLLDSLKGTCDNDCDECRPHAERNAHYLTALQELIKGDTK